MKFLNHGISEGKIYSHTCMHTCVCIFIYVVVNNLIDTNVFSLLFGFLKSGFVSIGLEYM